MLINNFITSEESERPQLPEKDYLTDYYDGTIKPKLKYYDKFEFTVDRIKYTVFVSQMNLRHSQGQGQPQYKYLCWIIPEYTGVTTPDILSKYIHKTQFKNIRLDGIDKCSLELLKTFKTALNSKTYYNELSNDIIIHSYFYYPNSNLHLQIIPKKNYMSGLRGLNLATIHQERALLLKQVINFLEANKLYFETTQSIYSTPGNFLEPS
mgnify:CR=1 FL=1